VFSEPPLFSLDPDAAHAATRDLAPLVETAIATDDHRGFVDAFFSLMCPGLWARIDEDRKDRYRDNGEIGLTDLRSPSLDATDDDLSALAIPALVIAGNTSHPALRSVAHRLANALGDARFVELADCGHVTYVEQPDDFAHAVGVFAAELDDRSAPRAGTRDAGPTITGRFDVESRDGTTLAVWARGEGPAIVLVHGSIADHTTLTPLLDELETDMATFSMDRRGFGASGDSESYTIERDFDDVAAVIDAVAARTGGPVTVFGHSYGANCAMGAAVRTSNVHHLVLYEPSLGLAYPPGAIEAVETAVAAGDLDAAVVAIFSEILEMSDEEIDTMRASQNPPWSTRIASAWTLPRECRVEERWTYQPQQFDGIDAPVMLLAGSQSPADVAKATQEANNAIPDAQIQMLDGHAHMAHKSDPAMVAAVIRQFISA
jgi:pimeloyl-ACP methyl ester carboxylesterase